MVILVVTEDGTVQEFVKSKHDYLGFLSEAVQDWRKENEIPTDGINDDRVVLPGPFYHKTCQKTMRGQKEIMLLLLSFVEMRKLFLKF